MCKKFTIREVKENSRERVLDLYGDNMIVKRYYEIQRLDKYANDRNRLVPAMQQWRVLPKQDFEVIIEYMDGRSQVISGPAE